MQNLHNPKIVSATSDRRKQLSLKIRNIIHRDAAAILLDDRTHKRIYLYYKELLDQGILTQEEFDEVKKSLLKDLTAD